MWAGGKLSDLAVFLADPINAKECKEETQEIKKAWLLNLTGLPLNLIV